jgi:hypothetical protein
VGLYCGDVGGYDGEIGLCDDEVGLSYGGVWMCEGEVGGYCMGVGEYDGEVGEYDGEVALSYGGGLPSYSSSVKVYISWESYDMRPWSDVGEVVLCRP